MLRCLDPVSLGNLRLTCRQAYLLVSNHLTRATLTLADLVKFSYIPLSAVYPNVEVGLMARGQTVGRNSTAYL